MTSARYAVAILVLALPSSSLAAVRNHESIIPPDGKCYHGVAVSMFDGFEKDFTGFQKATGKEVAVLHWFTYAINRDGKPLDYAARQGKFFARCRQLGVIPCVNYVFGAEGEAFADFRLYTSGQMDGHLESMARLFLAYEEPILLSINHEMNGTWYPWSAGRRHKDEGAAVDEAENRSLAGAQRPPAEVFRDYIASWRYIHRFLRQAGCTNVAFCFVASGGAYAQPEKNPHDYKSYYPGNEFVDWIGMDTYNNNSPQKIDAMLREMERLAPGKPMIIKEWGTTAKRARAYAEGRKNYPGDAAWVNQVFNVVEQHPRLKVLCYFHRGEEHRIDLSGKEATLDAYRKRIASDRYLAKPLTKR